VCACADPENGDVAFLARFGASANCSAPCAGDERMVCGGAAEFSLFAEGAAAARRSFLASFGAALIAALPYSYLPTGCFQ
jgi:hypothetical protein